MEGELQRFYKHSISWPISPRLKRAKAEACGTSRAGMILSGAPSLPSQQGCLTLVKTHRRFVVVALVVLLGQACAGAKLDSSNGGGSGGNGGPLGGGGSLSINPDATSISPPHYGREASVGDAKPYRCDDAGNCNICLAILSLGQSGLTGSSTGNNGDTNAFQDYMNTNTNAKMTMLKTFTPLTDSLLNQYDVVILQALEDSPYNGLWTYQQSDIDVLAKWVKAGGAIIAMSGYGSNPTEVNPLNQLLSFSGISYGTADTFGSCPNNMCYCADSSVAFNNWLTTYADYPAITHDLKKVGVFYGRPVNCTGSDCQVFAKDPSSGGGNVGVAQVVGNGRVFAWGDEWVTYTSQWGLTPTQWDTHAECAGYTAKSSYSVPQFWYNAFKWLVPSAACFTIDQPTDPGQQIVY